jgi:hypothetical protein
MRLLALLLIVTFSVLAQDSGYSNANASAQAGGAYGSTPTTASSQGGGTIVPVVLTRSIDSKKAKAGDEVVARVAMDIRSGGQVVLPRDTKLIGKITQATARAKGDGTSQLGMAFDRAVLKNGSTLNVTTTIQAIAPPEQQSYGDSGAGASDMSSSSGGGPSGERMSSRGPEGTSSATGPVGADTAVNSAGTATGSIPHVAGSDAILTTRSVGVVGIKGLEMNTAASTDGSATLSSSGKNVKLDSGSRLLVRVTAASPAQPESPGGEKQQK